VIGLTLAVMLGSSALARQATFNAHDDYTEYHLLGPDTHQFRIVYFLNQRQVGATTVLNQTRSGSEGSDIDVTDPATGQPLKFEYRSGAELAAAGEAGRLAAAEHYIRAFLPRPVPPGGEGRVRIHKTYRDDRSYYAQGNDVVFARSLGIGRNAIVLPAGFAISSSNVAGQIVPYPDGRVAVVFENVNAYAADVVIRGRRSTATFTAPPGVEVRAFDFAKTLYDLGDPATHDVAVRHEYIERRRGATPALEFLGRHHLTEVVVTDMDTGQFLPVTTRNGVATVRLETPIARDTQSAHLRVAGRDRDPAYRLDGGQLIWTGTLHAPRTTVILPAGFELAGVTTPATVTTARDGRVAVQIYNPRLEPAAVTIRAVRPPA
jgi:hypothetical protein